MDLGRQWVFEAEMGPPQETGQMRRTGSVMRRLLNIVITGISTGVLILGVAWATTGLVPVGSEDVVSEDLEIAEGADSSAVLEPPVQLEATVAGQRLPEGVFLVGAHNASIAPVTVADGGDWNPHGNGYDCGPFAQEYTPDSDPSCLRTFDREWATGVDHTDDLGVYARAMAIGNGEDTVAFVVIDAISWFYGYDPSLCPDDPEALQPQDTCGSRAIAESLSEELGIPAKNFVIAAQHTHASVDTTANGPAWYYEHVRDQIKEALRGAVANMQPAKLETGATDAKHFNVDRRYITRAVPDYELNWLRAVALPPGEYAAGGQPGEVPPGQTIATLVNYAVHPTITAGNKDLHSGLIGHLDERLRELWGGSTVFFPGGLGDQTVDRGIGRKGHGYGLADLIFESAPNATTIRSNEIVTEQRVLTIPADNMSLVALNKAGIFMRDTTIPGPHAAGPSQSVQQKGGANTPSCVGSGPVSVLSPVGGFRIGSPGAWVERDGYQVLEQGDALVIMQAPGEIFASMSLVTKDYMSRADNVMVLGMANDHIGYIIPSEQYDLRGANVVGIAQPTLKTTNYEEALSTGRCTGDQIQNELVLIGESLGVLGRGEDR